MIRLWLAGNCRSDTLPPPQIPSSLSVRRVCDFRKGAIDRVRLRRGRHFFHETPPFCRTGGQ